MVPTHMEPLEVRVFASAQELAEVVADELCALAAARRAAGARCVLALPTGRTPAGVYAALGRRCRSGSSLAGCVVFGLDEYYPIEPGAVGSHDRELVAAMADLDLRPSDLHCLRGDVPRRRVDSHCTDFERSIRRAGGMDLALLGVGRNGHVAFNEPGSAASSRTRHVALSELTRQDAALRFGSEALVPRHALTMGVETILEARRALILAVGEHKAPIVARLLRERPSAALPASFLGLHAAASLLVDAAAASRLGGHEGSGEIHA